MMLNCKAKLLVTCDLIRADLVRKQGMGSDILCGVVD